MFFEGFEGEVEVLIDVLRELPNVAIDVGSQDPDSVIVRGLVCRRKRAPSSSVLYSSGLEEGQEVGLPVGVLGESVRRLEVVVRDRHF